VIFRKKGKFIDKPIFNYSCSIEDIIKHLQKSEDDIENGRTIPANEVFKDLRDRYGY